MKIQPSPKREKFDLSKDEELTPFVIFEEPARTIMDNPLPATAARLAKRRLQEQLTSETDPTTTASQQSLPSSFPEMPSSPTPDTILEWLGSSQQASFCSFPESLLRSFSPSKFNPHECVAAKLSMARTLLPQAGILHSSDGAATAEHIEHITEEKLVTVPESRLQMLEANMRKSELTTQLSVLEKEVLKISLSDKDFVTKEQQILEDDAELKTLQKSADAGLELLKRIQYNNPICKDDPSVFQEAYDHWVALRQSVAIYLFNRSGAQHENEIKWQKYKDLYQMKKALLADIEDVNATFPKLGGSTVNIKSSERNNADRKGPAQADVNHKKPPRRDSGVALLDTETAPYFPSSPSLAILLTSDNNKVNDSDKSVKANRSAIYDCVIRPRYISSRPEVNAKIHLAKKTNPNTTAGA
ncbi:hypothetical protein DL98DRAFT_568973 [Cadophora sp. DSE1049]|nr:hypothetical protein DL98DRAFT_568973 [Cadophora sp. DSE1049]